MTDTSQEQLKGRLWAELEPQVDTLRRLIPRALWDLAGGRDDVVGVALVTVPTGEDLVPVALSEGQRVRLEREAPRELVLGEWSPPRWDIALWPRQRTGLEEIATRARKVATEIEDVSWRSLATEVVDWYAARMAELADEGFFAEVFPDANVVFDVVNGPRPVERVVDWVERLNPPDRAAPYVEWLREREAA